MVIATLNITRHAIDGSTTSEKLVWKFEYKGYNKALNQKLDRLIAESNANVRAGTEAGTLDIEITSIDEA